MPLGRIIDIRKRVFADVKVDTEVLPSMHFVDQTSTQTFSNLGSQIGDERPVSSVRFSPNNEMLATASWSGSVKLWNMPSCTPIRTLRGSVILNSICMVVADTATSSLGHSDRVGGLAWHPQATLSQSPDSANLASGAGDNFVHLWSLNRWVGF